MPDQPRRPAFADIGDLAEDERIGVIGHFVMHERKTTAFIVEDDTLEKGKADRYVAKLTARFPGVVVLDRFPGPVPNTTAIKLGPPPQPETNQ